MIVDNEEVGFDLLISHPFYYTYLDSSFPQKSQQERLLQQYPHLYPFQGLACKFSDEPAKDTVSLILGIPILFYFNGVESSQDLLLSSVPLCTPLSLQPYLSE